MKPEYHHQKHRASNILLMIAANVVRGLKQRTGFHERRLNFYCNELEPSHFNLFRNMFRTEGLRTKLKAG